jgi:hypothetical protein
VRAVSPERASRRLDSSVCSSGSGSRPASVADMYSAPGTQFTCFTGTKVQILTLTRLQRCQVMRIGSGGGGRSRRPATAAGRQTVGRRDRRLLLTLPMLSLRTASCLALRCKTAQSFKPFSRSRQVCQQQQGEPARNSSTRLRYYTTGLRYCTTGPAAGPLSPRLPAHASSSFAQWHNPTASAAAKPQRRAALVEARWGGATATANTRLTGDVAYMYVVCVCVCAKERERVCVCV